MFRDKSGKNHSITSFFQSSQKTARPKNGGTLSQTEPKKQESVVAAARSSSMSANYGNLNVTNRPWMTQPQGSFDDINLEDIFSEEADKEYFSEAKYMRQPSIRKAIDEAKLKREKSQENKHLPTPTLATKSSSTFTTSYYKRPRDDHVPAGPSRVLPWDTSNKKPKTKSTSTTSTVKISGIELSRRVLSTVSRSTPSNAVRMPSRQSLAQPTQAPDINIQLSQEQKKVMDMVLNGTSLFFTGAAGTGKSVLLREIIKRLTREHTPDSVAVTASTGLAALNIGGETLHRFAGIGLGKGDTKTLVGMVKKRQDKMNKWRRCKILIIDEVSMVDGVLLDKLDRIGREVRNNRHNPFGGIQVVLTGDFFQLPPVDDSSKGFGKEPKSIYAFESNVWKEALETTVVLTQVFRQQGDNMLIGILNAMRLNKLTPPMIQELYKLKRKVNYTDSIEPTELYPTRREVDTANRVRLQSLKGYTHIYKTYDMFQDNLIQAAGMTKDQILKMLDNNTLASQEVHLRHDSQVMLIRNKDNGLVNGSIGKVIAFLSTVEFGELARLAMDVKRREAHTPEEMVLADEAYKEAINNLARALESSREAGSGFDPENLDMSGIKTHLCMNENILYPIVQFSGYPTLEIVKPDSFEITNKQNVIARRNQIPLILSWAMSVHKSQGQTLQRVRVNLAKTFENGQAYVAVSRATSADCLEIINFHPSKVRAEQKVVEFYKSLVDLNGDAQRAAEEVQEQKKKKELDQYFEHDDDGFI